MHYLTPARPSSPCSTVGSNYSGVGKSRAGRRCKEKNIAELERPLAELERLKYKRSRRRASRQRRRDEFMVQRSNAIILLQALLRGALVRTKIAKLREKAYQEKQLRIRRMEEWARYISSIQEIAVLCTVESTSRATRGINYAVELGRKRRAAGENINIAIRNHLIRRKMSANLIIRMWRQRQKANAHLAHERRKLSPKEAERARRKRLVMEKRRMRYIHKKEVAAQEMLAKSKLEGEKERLEAVRNKKLQNMKLAAKVRLDEENAEKAERIEKEAMELKRRNLEEIKRKEMEALQRQKRLEMIERKTQAHRLASKHAHTNQEAIQVERKGPTTAVQKTINEHQKTTDHTARSSHRSVLRDTTKGRAETSVACTFGTVSKTISPVAAQTKGGEGHDYKLSRKKSPLPPPILSTASGLPTSGGNDDNDVPSKKPSKETSHSRTQHRVPHIRRESNNELLQANKKLLAKPPPTSSRGTTKHSSMQRPVSPAVASSVPSPPRNELPPVVNRLPLTTNSGIIPVSSKQTKGGSDNNESQREWQAHSVGSFRIIDDNKFEDISDNEALLMIK